MGYMIKEYFKDGSKHGVEIDYIEETKPLGTGGSIRFLKNVNNQPFVVTNGDVISDIDFEQAIDFHIEQKSYATVVIRPHEIRNPYGVLETDGIDIVKIEEKPTYRSHILTGAYIFHPGVIDLLVDEEEVQIPNFLNHLRILGFRTIAFHVQDKWMDIGNPNDLIGAESYFDELDQLK